MKKFLIPLVAFASLAQVALAAPTLGVLNEVIPLGKSLSVGLGASPTGQWFVVSNSNPNAASGFIFGDTLVIHGLANGTAKILACSELAVTNCLEANVNVGGSVLGAVTAHAVGSWVLSGKTVFYVHQSGLIPISTWNIFLSNGGKQSLIQPANNTDLNLPLLPLMISRDSRVK